MGKRIDLANQKKTAEKTGGADAISHLKRELGALAGDGLHLFSSHQHALDELFLAIYMDVVRTSGRTQIIAPSRSHSRLEKLGCSCKAAGLNARGQLSPQDLKALIRPRTALVSLTWADPYTGVVQPLQDLISVARKEGILVHVDASSVLGKLYFRFQDLDADFLTFGSSDAGALLMHGRSSLNSLASQSSSHLHLQSVTQEVREAAENFEYLSTETARLRDLFEQEILERCPEARLLFSDVERLPNVSAIVFRGISGETLLFHLERNGVIASLGENRSLAPDLLSAHLDPLSAYSAVSFALSSSTSEEEIREAAEVIKEAVDRLKPLFGEACLSTKS